MKKIKLLAPLLSITATAGAVVPVTVGCNAERDNPKTYAVSLSQDEADKEFTSNVTLDVTEAKEGEDYLGKVTIKDVTKFQLVNQSITITGIESNLPKITYVKDEKTGTFTSAIIEIAKDNISDNLTISGKLAEYIAPLEFVVEQGAMDTNNTATLTIKWEPQRDITFDTLEAAPGFDYGDYKEATVSSIEVTQSGTAEVKLLFGESIIINDIDDGILTFTYTDVKLAKQQRIEISDIAISKYVPEKLEFYVDSPTMIESNFAQLQLWKVAPEATDDIEIINDSIVFKYDNDKKQAPAAYTYWPKANPCIINISFSEPIAFNDITDGHLIFNYTGNEPYEIRDIHINKYVPPEDEVIFIVTEAYAQPVSDSTYVYITLDWLPVDSFTLSNIKLLFAVEGIECEWSGDVIVGEGTNQISNECKHISESLDDGQLTFHYNNGNGLEGDAEIWYIHLDYIPE